ncbi:hypothetical protein MBLNU459_g5861t1 [Dothideomycetes sp. NU459]
MDPSAALDAHARPPEPLRQRYKQCQKAALTTVDADQSVFDAQRHNLAGCRRSSFALPDHVQEVIRRFLQSAQPTATDAARPVVYEHPSVPGLFIVPNLLPPEAQLLLLDTLLHRHLSDPTHKTNLHLHYDIKYPPPSISRSLPSSFFGRDALDLVQTPKDATVHKPLSTSACLNKKFRWVTLGGQYDWTQKAYPSTAPPPFPEDVASLVQGLFPSMKAQAAIVNLYSPGDTLSLHRDVSEQCSRPLVSISLGCDGIFIAGLAGSDDRGDVPRDVTIRLRSGDAVVMSGASRYAWHGVPQILPDTCPDWMAQWPYQPTEEPSKDGENYEHWKGWMARKRINLNVRQMWD